MVPVLVKGGIWEYDYKISLTGVKGVEILWYLSGDRSNL